MALIRVAQYSSTPTVVGDYQAQNAHLQAFTNQLLTQQFILSEGTAQPVIKQGCYVSHGGSLYVADADTAITGSPANGSVYIRVSGTTSLTVEFVTDISGYTWNPVYTALTNGSYTLLPYLIVKASTVWTRYNFNPQNHNFGAIKATSIDTGQGATEVHLMNQNLRTTDSPTFATVNTGQGANELYPMNQAVRTTDNVSFASVDTGHGANDVYKKTYQALTVGAGSNLNLSDMGFMETKYFSAVLQQNNSSGSSIKTPSSGSSFLVLCHSARIGIGVVAGLYNANTAIASVGSQSTNANVTGLILRVS
jgi:hypothetical protein